VSAATVRLGFEVGTGAEVLIPLRHMVVTGQTQEAGKTTALEALIARSGVQAVVFITKRGEGSFADARVIPPYFREQADWKYVAAILEASRGEKLRFERSWIIRASKGAQSLADVQRNVRRFLADPKTKGINADVYLTLEAYLDDVVPEIGRVRWAQTVDVAPGLSAMDLGGLKVEMQHLVIRSTLEWVLEHAEETVVVVPEAWKFIPQGRGTPVKLAAEAYIRQAATLHNYLWLDSQDIAGVEKMILKSVPVWILGVQRESNEVKRTLDQIPAGIKKPKPEAVATLGLGEFYACHGQHITKVYAQPVWATEAKARAVALGDNALPPRPHHQEVQVNEAEARALREENAELRRRIAELEERLEALAAVGRTVGKPGAKMAPPAPSGREVEAPPSPAPALREGDPAEEMYQLFKARLLAEAPAILRVLTTAPEIDVEVQRDVIRVDGRSLRGRIARLIAEGYFDAARTSASVLEELLKRGASRPSNIELGNEMKALCDMGFFVRENKWYTLVPNAKVKVTEAA
jgi:hypothetical protein